MDKHRFVIEKNWSIDLTSKLRVNSIYLSHIVFRDDSIKIFVLSIKTGSLNINLTGADTVIIHDVDFNPLNDRLAEDRCHNLEQTKYEFVNES